MTDERREKIYQWVMACGLQDVLFYKVKDAKGREIVMDRFESFEAFAWHAEKDEREACALLCYEQRKHWDALACADAIRAGTKPRGQA